jgi:S-DNA-T family DNA segregation ATPase FtsK/SpoIIIE
VELPLTVTDSLAGVERDLLVRCDPSLPVGDLISAMTSELTGRGGPESPTAVPVYVGARRLDATTSVGRAGVLPGAVLSVGAARGKGQTSDAAARYELAIIGGLIAGPSVRLPEGTMTIGRGARCDVVLRDDEASRLHASITIAGDDVTIEDLHSSNGTTVNGIPVTAPTVIRPSDLIGIGGSILTVRLPPGPAAEYESTGDGRVRFNKPPRRFVAPGVATFELPKKPEKVQGRHFSLLAAVAPLLIGVVIWAATRQTLFLLFSLASPMMLGANFLSDRRTGRRSFAKRMEEYEAATTTLSARLDRAVRDDEQQRRRSSPDPSTVAAIATTPTQQLWERRRTDPDYLVARIGLRDRPANVELKGGAGSPEVDPPVARTVPVTVAIFAAGVVGVAGARQLALDVIRSIVLQLAVLHSPNDLSIVLLSGASPEGWDWIKWLPHTVPNGASEATRLVGMAADQRRARIDELVSIVEYRRASPGRRSDADARSWPTILLLLDDVTRLRDEDGVAYLLQEGPAVGVVAVCLAAESPGLPAEAAVSIEVHIGADGLATLSMTSDAGVMDSVLPDGIDEALAAEVARALAPFFEVAALTSASKGLPSSVDELDLLGLETPTAEGVLERWGSVAVTDRLPALVGVIEEGPFTIDLVHDGPHVLLAGMTGSGKSGFLQTLVASLAATSRPDAVTFLLVDFKGGSAFTECARLPHALGLISNLDGRLVERALDSIQAELTWRQTTFREAGAEDYKQYVSMRSPDAPAMPRLVVVVDELKELSDAYADAIPRLNQAARLGRSLGLHLVLGTQKPSSVGGLSDLRANTDLSLCLRVVDEADSREVLNVPDAASIRRTDVGRGIARHSDGSLSEFQTGFLGGRVRSERPLPMQRVEVEPFEITSIGSPQHDRPSDDGADGMVDSETGLQSVVDAVGRAAGRLDLPAPRLPWLAPLPTAITLDDPRLARGIRAPAFPIGLVDLPDQQRQEPLVFDFDELTHVLVIGPGRSGRSTLLRSLAGSIALHASPADVHLYCLEFRRPGLGDLEALPNCGAVVGIGDTERLERCLLFLETELERRARPMSGNSSLTEQRARAGPGEALPYILVLCDNYEAFHERFSYEDGGRLVDRFGALLSEGPGSGIHFVITTDRRGLQTKLGASVEARLLLRPTDRDDQLALGVTGKTLPLGLPPGRGFWYRGASEVQVALLGSSQPGATQISAIAEVAQQTTADAAMVDRHRMPPRIPPLPPRITAEQGEALRQFPRPNGRAVVTVGIAGIQATTADVDLDAAGGTFVIAGPRGSGRSTALLTVAASLLSGGRAPSLCVVSPRRSPLRSLAGQSGIHVLTSLDSLAGELADVLADASGPLALIIDDAELLTDTSASARLDRVVRSATDNELLIVIGGTTSELSRRFSGWIFDARQSRSGLLLWPSSAADGEVLDIRLPRSIGSGHAPPPGRGVLAVRGNWTNIQVFLTSP